MPVVYVVHPGNNSRRVYTNKPHRNQWVGDREPTRRRHSRRVRAIHKSSNNNRYNFRYRPASMFIVIRHLKKKKSSQSLGSLYLQDIIIVFIITITRSLYSLESCCNNNIIIRSTDRHRFFTPLLQRSVYYYCLLCDDRHWRGKCVVENNTLLWYHIIIYYWIAHQLHTHVWRHRNFRICLVSVAFIPNTVQCYQFGMILYSYIRTCTQPTHNIIRC